MALARLGGGDKPAVASDSAGIGLKRDVGRLVGQNMVPGRLGITPAQADHVMVAPLLPAHLGLGGKIFRKIAPLFLDWKARTLRDGRKVITHCGK